MEIRSLTPADAPAYWRLRQHALEQEPLAFGSDAQEHRLISLAETADRLTASPEKGFTMGLFLGGASGSDPELVGTATFLRHHGIKQRHKGHIVGVFLAAPYRGRGLARALLTAVLAHLADDPTLDQVLLGVSSTQTAAFRLYQQLGFALCGTEPRALKIGSDYIDEHMMIRLLR